MDSMEEVVITKAPIRVDFAGGPSDVAPFSIDEWGYVVNATINKYAVITIKRRKDKCIVITSDDLHLQEVYSSILELDHNSPLKLITKIVEIIGSSHGLDIHIKNAVPLGSGLGSSAAISSALIYALHKLEGNYTITSQTLARKAIQCELEGLKNTVGGQDQYAAAFGGFQSFKFQNGNIKRRNLIISKDTLSTLNHSLFLCYSGESHISGKVLDEVMERYNQREAAVIQNLRSLREIALKVEKSLELGSIDDLGELLNAAWAAQRSLHSGISTHAIEEILEIAIATGATGGKVTGAGGGGYVLIACHPSKKRLVKERLQKALYSTMEFLFVLKGTEIVLDPNLPDG